ncbi:thiamine phosphate synthase [Geopsychrobacter electrodiphilus]|uniref:thiamine phosphate synthase n=1 Tax=Geopsychrobacter electrodiphilus TaxID=225196 RepID=UPI0003770DF3|nr:thiamine phosphate synthase [Geopsychrobacter electrodiphilus]
MSGGTTSDLPSLYLITDRKLTSPDLLFVLEAALKAGVRLLQLREKDLSPSALRALAGKVLILTRSYGAKLLLNGSLELAIEIGADGVQLGIDTEKVFEARKILGQRALIGFSAHSPQEVEDAASQGADFATFGPVYFTASKAQYGPPQGLNALQELCNTSSIPIYALGGINPDRINEVINAGAYGVALISAVMAEGDPHKAVRLILQKMTTSHAQLRNTL